MKRILPTAVYAAGHFLVDFACAFLMFRMVWGSGSWLPSVLLYNFFAFAVQMPLGLLADRTGSGRLFAAAGCLLTAASCVLGAWPTALSVTAGLGNALFHIGGGRDTLAVSGDRARLLGVFVSPGAFGLFLGAMLGRGSAGAAFVPILLIAAAAAILLCCDRVPAERTGPAVPSGSCFPALCALFALSAPGEGESGDGDDGAGEIPARRRIAARRRVRIARQRTPAAANGTASVAHELAIPASAYTMASSE